MGKDKEQIYLELKKTLNKLFEIELDSITLESRLYEELDLDSIDAVDLIVHLQTITKHKFKPEEFKSVKTVSDVVDVIYTGLQSGY
ncbi:MAG: acyl carrier protein [Legionellales bacterium]|nr:acyl carrier protein [Legionellales bacterium]